MPPGGKHPALRVVQLIVSAATCAAQSGELIVKDKGKIVFKPSFVKRVARNEWNELSDGCFR